MCNKKNRPVLFTIVIFFLFTASAQAGSTAVEINANADEVGGVVEYDTQNFGAVLSGGGGIIFGGDDYTIGDLHIALKDEVFFPALTLGLGFKGVAGRADVSDSDYDVAAIGFSLLGEYDFRKIYLNFPVLIYAAFNGSPDPLSFSDTTSYVDFDTGIRAYIVRSAAVVAGYRAMRIDFKEGGTSDTLNTDAFYIGLRLTF